MASDQCPECRQGKHANCDGRMWDWERDVEIACACMHPHHDRPLSP